MLKHRSIAVFLAIALFAAPGWAQRSARRQSPSGSPSELATHIPESLSSPAAAVRFREIARELVDSNNVTGQQAEQAIILLTAARSLDRGAADIEPLLLQLATHHAEKDYSDQMLLWLQDYVSESADRRIVMDAVRYLLDGLDSGERRGQMLETLAKKIGNRNAALDSELALLLGLLTIEQGNQEAALFYLPQAYANNKYNKAAFAKLAELAPNEIGPAVYLEHLRLTVRENPLNINAAAAFAQYTDRLQLYDLAAQSYQYCAELFRYLYPSEPLPPHIYLPWAISCYNSRQNRHVSLQIAESVRNRGQFDILLEAIAGKAAAKAGMPDEAKRIFQQAEEKAMQLIQSEPAQQGATAPARQLTAKHLAWFYSFANIDPDKAVYWANQAYSDEPNSPSAGALLAYAFCMHDQLEWAKPLLTAFEHTQIADLVQARIHFAAGDRAAAIRTLNAAIAKDPGSLAAERAREILRELGQEYVSPVDTAALMTFLTQNLGRTVAPQFVPPDKLIGVQFNVRGSDFSYGNDLDGVISIANRGLEPLVITSDGLFQGSFRISARVSGAIDREIPNLLSRTVRTEMLIAPGRSFTHTVRLSTGELGRLLRTYPQASLDIQFTLYLDPVAMPDGTVSNRLVDVKPVTISIHRPGVEIDGKYVRSRHNAIASGQQGQKIQTARLFTGLLREQQAIAEHGTLYPYRYAEWLPELLRSSLVSPSGLLLSQGRDDWVVQVNTMADMLSMHMDQELANVVARNLNHPRWPVRLMAIYLLANRPGDSLQPVLDWVAQQDAHELVRQMALSFQSMTIPAAPTGRPDGRSPALWP